MLDLGGQLHSFDGGEDAEALEALSAAEVGKAVAGGGGEADLFFVDFANGGDFSFDLVDFFLEARAFAFEGESDVDDFLAVQSLEGFL